MSAFSSNSISIKPCIFSLADLEKMYPKSDYPTTARGVKYAVHYLLALKQPDANILKYIDQLAKKNIMKLFCKDDKCQNLTPLMLAVILGRIHVVEKLVSVAKQKKILPELLNSVDQYLWTPLHHAAISSKDIFELLKRSGAKTDTLNNKGATPYDIKVLTTKGSGRFSERSVSVLQRSGEMIPLSKVPATELNKQLGITTYRDLPYVPQGEVRHLWEEQEKGFEHLLIPAIERMIENPPRVIIQECKELRHIEMSKELIADQDIPYGEAVMLYGGEVAHDRILYNTFADCYNSTNLREMYSAPPIYAHEVGNIGRYSNTGFPNVQVYSINYRGYTTEVFISLGIKKGDKITYAYGAHFFGISYGKQILFRRDEMRMLFKNGEQPLLKEIQKSQDIVLSGRFTLNEWFRANEVSQYIWYCLSTPAAILDLHFSGLVNVDYWFYGLMNYDDETILIWVKENSLPSWYLRAFLLGLITFQQILNLDPALKKVVSQWVLDHLEDLSVMQLMHGFKLISDQFLSNNTIDWNDYLKHLAESLHEYDWNKDPNPTVGKNGVSNVMREFYSRQTEEYAIDDLALTLKNCEKFEEWKTHEIYGIVKEVAALYGVT